MVSQDGLKKIYTAGLDKHAWYQKTFYNYGHANLVCILDHRTHFTQKRMLSKLYTKSYLQRSENMANLSKHIILTRLGPLLQRSIHGKDGINVVELFEWTGLDFVTAYLFGLDCGTDFLHDEESRYRYFNGSSKKQGACCTLPEELCMRMCKSVLAIHSEGKQSNEPEPVVFSTMYNAARKACMLQVSDADVLTRCASEMLDHMIATQETNTITWTYILYRLSLHHDLQVRLRNELLTLQPHIPPTEGKESLPTAAAIDSLPLLHAVVYETLRLHAANPARMLRVAPAFGLELHGYYIPRGTTVSTNAYCLHRNPEAFPGPMDWRPERWLRHGSNPGSKAGDSSRAEAMRWFWAFVSGPRMCIGTNFAVQGPFISLIGACEPCVLTR